MSNNRGVQLKARITRAIAQISDLKVLEKLAQDAEFYLSSRQGKSLQRGKRRAKPIVDDWRIGN